MAPLTTFQCWTMSWAWRHQKSLMVRLRSAARSVRSWRMSSCRRATCLSSSSCSWPCVAGQNPGDAPHSASVSCSAALGWMPCREAFAWYAAGAHAARASYRRIAAWSRFPLLGGPLLPRPTPPRRAVAAPPWQKGLADQEGAYPVPGRVERRGHVVGSAFRGPLEAAGLPALRGRVTQCSVLSALWPSWWWHPFRRWFCWR